ncbi:MAG: hypothetical protein AAGC60_16700 [Acidobacteriota bacterium]
MSKPLSPMFEAQCPRRGRRLLERCLARTAPLLLLGLLSFPVVGCIPRPDVQDTTADCSFLDGDFTAPLDAATCTDDPRACAEFLNACLKDFDYLDSDLWVLKAPQGAVPVRSLQARSVRALASPQGDTPMHGRFNTVFLNQTAAEAFNAQIVRDPQGHIDRATLPDGSVLIKHNFTTAEASPPRSRESRG